MEQLLRQTNAQGRSDKQETGSKSCEAAPKIAQRSVHGDYARNFTRTTTMDNPAMVQKNPANPLLYESETLQWLNTLALIKTLV